MGEDASSSDTLGDVGRALAAIQTLTGPLFASALGRVDKPCQDIVRWLLSLR